MSIEGQGQFFTIYFPGFVCFVLYKAKISGERLQDHWSTGYVPVTPGLRFGKAQIYMYKQKWHCQGYRYLWLLCCMSNLYIPNGLIYIQLSAFGSSTACLSVILVSSWFDSVCVTVTCWVNFIQKYLHVHKLQLSDNNI